MTVIKPPQPDLGRALWRAVFEAGAQFSPVTAALARLYQTTHPSQLEQEVAAWRTSVTDTVNEHAIRLHALETTYQPRLILSEAAETLALWLARESPSAHRDGFDYGVVQTALPHGIDRDVEGHTGRDGAAPLMPASNCLLSP